MTMTTQLMKESNTPNFLIEMLVLFLKYRTKPNIFTDARKDEFISTKGRHKKYATMALSVFFGILCKKIISTQQNINAVII
jgi:hypothetical protein